MGDYHLLTRSGFWGAFFRLARFLHMDESQDGDRFSCLGGSITMARWETLGVLHRVTKSMPPSATSLGRGFDRAWPRRILARLANPQSSSKPCKDRQENA